MNIVKLEAENILRLNAVEITPDGRLVVIGGNNGHGKTSVLDSIMLAMNGKDSKKHPVPLHKGADKGTISVDLGELVVTRTFTKGGGSSLKVTKADGATFPSPQSMLNSLTGALSFDPMAWVAMDNKKQLATLQGLVGLDFTEMDGTRKEIFEARTDANRDAKNTKARLDAMTEYKDAPKEFVSVSNLIAQADQDRETNLGNKKVRDTLAHWTQTAEAHKAEIKRLESLLEAEKFNLETAREGWKKRNSQVKTLVDADVDGINAKIASAEFDNEKFRSNEARIQLAKDLKTISKNADSKTKELDKIDADKAAQLAAAKFPVEGLSFDETGVLFNGIPFAQASAAEKLRVSVAMGIAMNPEFKVMLIRDGSLLDETNLATVAEMAAKSGAQVWIERVGKGKECQVIIEDGYVEA